MTLNVLIIDDDKMIILLHKVMVARSKLSESPLSFSDGKIALEFLSAEFVEDQHYLILLDINMPVMNGWEFLDAIQTMPFAQKLSVIMVTSSVDTGDKIKAKQYSQVIHFLEKPLKMDTCNYIKTLPAVVSFFS